MTQTPMKKALDELDEARGAINVATISLAEFAEGLAAMLQEANDTLNRLEEELYRIDVPTPDPKDQT